MLECRGTVNVDLPIGPRLMTFTNVGCRLSLTPQYYIYYTDGQGKTLLGRPGDLKEYNFDVTP